MEIRISKKNKQDLLNGVPKGKIIVKLRASCGAESIIPVYNDGEKMLTKKNINVTSKFVEFIERDNKDES